MTFKGIFRPRTVFVALTILFSGCASTGGVVNFSSLSSQDQLPKPDKELWKLSQYEADFLQKSGLIYSDSIMGNYLQEVGMKVVPEDLRKSIIPFRFQVILDPELNAFSLPDGNIFIHLGLLARLENESQLALVLAHEIDHVINRHAVKHYVNIKNLVSFTEIFSTALNIGFSAMKSDWAGFWNILAQSTLYLTAIASIMGYERVVEKQADLEGLQYMLAANYDVEEAPRVFEILLDEYNDPSALASFFYSNYHRLKERKKYVAAEVKAHPQTRMLYQEDNYRALTALIRSKVVELWVRAGKYHNALKDSKPILGESPEIIEVRFWRGEAYRQMTENPDTLELARQEFMRAIQLAPNFAEPHRGLAFLAEIRQDVYRAVQEFQKYLDLAPNARDKRFIMNRINELSNDSQPEQK